MMMKKKMMKKKMMKKKMKNKGEETQRTPNANNNIKMTDNLQLEMISIHTLTLFSEMGRPLDCTTRVVI